MAKDAAVLKEHQEGVVGLRSARDFSPKHLTDVLKSLTDSLVYWSIVVLCAQFFLACQTLILPWSIMMNNGLSCRLEIPFSQKRNEMESADLDFI